VLAHDAALPSWLFPLAPRNHVVRASIPLLSTSVAVGLWALFGQHLASSPFLLFTAAVALSAFYGGLGPAIAAIGASTVACVLIYYVPFLPFESEGTQTSRVLLHFLMFLLVSLLIAALQVARQRAEYALALQALHDPLTGLPNRRLFADRFNQLVGDARRNGQSFALVLLDLDAFKAVNDAYGHQQGDVVLVEVAQRLASHIRTSDTIARVGGDEFALLLPKTDKLSASRLLAKLKEFLAEPILLLGGQLSVSVSVGLAVYPDDGTGQESLLDQADTAMYCDKRGTGQPSIAPAGRIRSASAPT
jgi:diguanylate cyclase (GGDEF)-like protein